MATTDRSRILMVDDNDRVRSFVRPALEDAGFECLEASDGWTALGIIESQSPDLVVLDIQLGDQEMSGLDVCKRMREQGTPTPVIFLTVKDRIEEPFYMERALQLGADDYMTKREELGQLESKMGLIPTEHLERKSDMAELVARIRARLRDSDALVEVDDYLRIDFARQQVHVKRKTRWEEERLAPKEFALLSALVKNRGRPVGKNRLMAIADVLTEGSIQNQIWKLRQKLEPEPHEPRYIQTYHKMGYRFNRPE
jgi:DNA-binding response OmpR family regulator